MLVVMKNEIYKENTMSGVTKHIFDHDIRDIVSMWNEQLKEIQNVLPQYYTNEDIALSFLLIYTMAFALHFIRIISKYK